MRRVCERAATRAVTAVSPRLNRVSAVAMRAAGGAAAAATRTPQEVLKQYWGYDAFRPAQLGVIEAVLRGQGATCDERLPPRPKRLSLTTR